MILKRLTSSSFVLMSVSFLNKLPYKFSILLLKYSITFKSRQVLLFVHFYTTNIDYYYDLCKKKDLVLSIKTSRVLSEGSYEGRNG